MLVGANWIPDDVDPDIPSVAWAYDYPPNKFYPRTREQFTTFFEGLELLEPGVVPLVQWRPEPHADFADGPERDQVLAGVGRKP
jgi:hypothetical protein